MRYAMVRAFFFFGGFLHLPVQEEIKIATHDQMRRQCELMGSPSTLGEKLMQHAESHLALSARALVDRRSHSSGADFRNKIGKQVGRYDGQSIEQVRVTSRFQYWNGCLGGHIDSYEVLPFLE